jgi:hypothetical protein
VIAVAELCEFLEQDFFKLALSYFHLVLFYEMFLDVKSDLNSVPLFNFNQSKNPTHQKSWKYIKMIF